eukprot:Skav222456  [mRNA]  locus=scaffold3319:109783:111610:- [translate_table: standard]
MGHCLSPCLGFSKALNEGRHLLVLEPQLADPWPGSPAEQPLLSKIHLTGQDSDGKLGVCLRRAYAVPTPRLRR